MKVRDQFVYFARLSGLERREAEAAADRWLERVGSTDRADDDGAGPVERQPAAGAAGPRPGRRSRAARPGRAVLRTRPGRRRQTEGRPPRTGRRGAAVLFSSHQLDLVADVSRDVVIVDGGRVVLPGDVARSARRRAPIRRRHRRRPATGGRRAAPTGPSRRPAGPPACSPRPRSGRAAGRRRGRSGRGVHVRPARPVGGVPRTPSASGDGPRPRRGGVR